jgi:hypothetical protein
VHAAVSAFPPLFECGLVVAGINGGFRPAAGRVLGGRRTVAMIVDPGRSLEITRYPKRGTL